MTAKRTAWVGGVLLAAAAVGVFAWHELAGESDGPAVARPSGPRVVCPPAVLLGPCDDGETVTALIPVRNDGDRSLRVYDVRTGCACRGLERATAAGYEPVREDTLAAGASTEYAVRFVATPTAPLAAAFTLRFATDDPAAPEVAVAVHLEQVRPGLVTVPAHVVLPDVVTGSTARARVEIRDPARTGRTVAEVRPVGMPGLAGTFTPAADTTDLLGYLDIVYTPPAAGPSGGALELVTAGPSPRTVRVQVSARPTAAVWAAPARIVLPYHSDAGPQYTRTVYVRSSDRSPKVRVVDPPADLEVQVLPPADGGTGTVRVTVREDARRPRTAVERLVVLQADGAAEPARLVVRIEPPGEGS